MNCKEIKRIIPDYIDSKLSDSESKEFSKHISSCENCNRNYENIKNTLGLLKPKAEIEEQAFYYTRLKQRMESRHNQRESVFFTLFSRKLVQPMIYLSSLIIAVYIGILIGSSTGSSEQYQFSDLNEENNYIRTYSEYQYLNDFEIETIENLLIEEDSEVPE